jgi:hypothetical protein
MYHSRSRRIFIAVNRKEESEKNLSGRVNEEKSWSQDWGERSNDFLINRLVNQREERGKIYLEVETSKKWHQETITYE